MAKEFDFIAIGDIVTDAFIRLENPSAHIDIDRGAREICMRFAEKIPYEDVYVVPAVGNSANAAVAAARLGLKSALVSNVGDDYFGVECLGVLRQEQVAADFIKTHKGMKTNYHYVLWYLDDRTILVKHEKYPMEFPGIGDPKWVYLSSLGGDSIEFHELIAGYLKTHKEVKLAFQPGTFQINLGREKLRYFYERAEVLICNKEEAERILSIEESEIKKLLAMLHEAGPRIVVITDGPRGAYASDGSTPLTTGGSAWFMPSYPDPKPPFERTGAGDAFSATFVAALALGKRIEEALQWAPINSMSVVQQVGARAGLLRQKEIEEYLAKAPPDYKSIPI